MKKLTVITVLIAICIVSIPTFQSCKKYEDGHAISFRKRIARVSNTWRVQNYLENGEDKTSKISDYTETFTKEGSYSYSWGVKNSSGSWAFQNRDTEIKLNGNDARSSRNLFILKLDENAFWYYYFEGNDKKEMHLATY